MRGQNASGGHWMPDIALKSGSALPKRKSAMIQMKVDTSGRFGVMSIEGELTAYHAVELKRTLIRVLGNIDHLVLDLERVTKVDISCLQLLCSLHNALAVLNKDLTVNNVSGIFGRVTADSVQLRRPGCVLYRNKKCLWSA